MFDGKAFGEEMVAVVKTYVDKATAPLLQRIAELEKRAPEKGEPGEPGRDGADGRDGVDGKDGRDGEPGAPGEDGAPGKDGAKGADGSNGKDGVGIADLLIDRDHSLVATFEDGRTKNLGRVVGRDGIMGAAGLDGKDGQDALGFDDITVEQTGERSFVVKFVQGERVKEFPFEMPVVLDRGVFKEGHAYKAGDAVTWAGSIWIAQKDTEAKPDSGDGWRLAVKRGRDGKDAR